MSNVFTDEEIAALSAEVDKQLRELSNDSVTSTMKSDSKLPGEPTDELPEKQCKAIEEHAKEDPKTFLQKFGDKAKKVLCEADSDLRKRYEIFGDLKKEEVLEKFGAILTVMGFSDLGLKILAVSLTVYLIRIGVTTFCKKYTDIE
ncbi:MAG: hypothetical protein GY749_26055 [Desulfobacteraceae bacterium]|nr:hypothetical protein [Desulfobacteraceae bacterium]